MFSQMSTFFSDLRTSIKSSMKGNGKNGGTQYRRGSKFRSSRRGRSASGVDPGNEEEEDVVKPRGCLGRSVSVEWGLNQSRKRRTSGASSEFLNQVIGSTDIRSAASMADIPSQRNRSGSNGGWSSRNPPQNNGQVAYGGATDRAYSSADPRNSIGYDNVPIYDSNSRKTNGLTVAEPTVSINRQPSYVDRTPSYSNDLYNAFDRNAPRLNGFGGSNGTDLNRSGGNLVGVADVSNYSIEAMCDPVLVKNTRAMAREGKENVMVSNQRASVASGGGDIQPPKPAPRPSRSNSGARIVQQDSIRSTPGSLTSHARTESYKASTTSLQTSGIDPVTGKDQRFSNRRAGRRNSPQISGGDEISTPLSVKIPSRQDNGSLGKSSGADGTRTRPRPRVIPAPTYETSPVWNANDNPLGLVGNRASLTSAATVPHSLHLNGVMEGRTADAVDGTALRLDQPAGYPNGPNINMMNQRPNSRHSEVSQYDNNGNIGMGNGLGNNGIGNGIGNGMGNNNNIYDNLYNVVPPQSGPGSRNSGTVNHINTTQQSNFTITTGIGGPNIAGGPGLSGMGSVVGGSTLSLYSRTGGEPTRNLTGSHRALNERRGSGGRGQIGATIVGGSFSAESMQYVNDCTNRSTYVKGKLLGKGGFAKCYELVDLSTGITFAGKIISRSRLTRASQKDKILREVDLHRKLDHRNVVKFRSYFEDEANVYIVLEYCSRKSLVHILKARRTLTEPEVRYYLHHLFNGVQYIHDQHIIHRDLKLGNMLLNEDMEVKIADFGLATRVEYEGEKKMTVCGTPNYIAPEVLQKRGHSYEADIWAMGCVMYALLCGRPPFETSTLKETYMRIVTNKYMVPPHVSLSAKLFIQRLLTSHPRDRPTLSEIATDDFFTSGYLPPTLHPSNCEVPPKFPVAQLLQQRPKSSALPVPSSRSHHVTSGSVNQGSSLAQSKNSRKSSSQIITRNKTPDYEMAVSLKDSDYQLAGSAPSIQRELSEELASLPYRSAARLHCLITLCLQAPAQQNAMIAQVQRTRTICVTKWVDYSNKYGFGFQLSNGCVGILFNDSTRMLLTNDSQTVLCSNAQNKFETFSTTSPPGEYQKKVTLLLYFSQYMETHLIPGSHNQASPTDRATSIFMKNWFRTDRAIVMYLTDGTLQVNFLEDHTKVILNPDGPDYLLTIVNQARQSNSYSLSALKHFGCTSDMLDRLRYACHMLERINNIETNDAAKSSNRTDFNIVAGGTVVGLDR